MNQTGLPPSAGEIERIVISVFDTMMGLSVESLDVPWHQLPDRITASVQFGNTMYGALLLDTDQPSARRFAGGLLGMAPPQTVDDDVRDALGELVNVIGGNLMTDTLSPGTTMSIPSVVDGGDFRVRICHTTVVLRQAFSADGTVFWVSWIAKNSPGRDGEARDAGVAGCA